MKLMKKKDIELDTYYPGQVGWIAHVERGKQREAKSQLLIHFVQFKFQDARVTENL